MPAPYSNSQYIQLVSWDHANKERYAVGSDLWPLTWGDDDKLYTAWGDGNGFSGGTSVSWGIATLEGTPPGISGTDVKYGPAGSAAGKISSLICVGGVLYALVNTQDGTPHFEIWSSDDHGLNWTEQTWNWDASVVTPMHFINFGKNNAGARDSYVYAYAETQGGGTSVYLTRVPNNEILTEGSWEWFTGTSGSPSWGAIGDRTAVFTDAGNVAGFTCSYHHLYDRYIATAYHTGYKIDEFGMFDAPEPWGPWTTIDYDDNWGSYDDTIWAISWAFNQKWIANGGQNIWVIFSGDDIANGWDSLNLINLEISSLLAGTTIMLPIRR